MKIHKKRLIEIITQEVHQSLVDAPPIQEGFIDKLKSAFSSSPTLDMDKTWDTVIKAAEDLEKRYSFAVKQNREFASKLEKQAEYIKQLQAQLSASTDQTVPDIPLATGEETEEIPLSQEVEKLLQRKLGL
jgi:hypothetical protein